MGLLFFRKIFDGSWGWRALRLMAKKSPHFFTYGNHPIGKLPEYLDQMLKKMVKDSTVSVNSSFASSISATNGSNKGNKNFFSFH